MKNYCSHKFLLLFSWLLLLLLCTSNTCLAAQKLSSYPVVQNFINTMVQQYQFDRNKLSDLLDSTTLIPKVMPSLQKTREPPPWYIYKNNLLTQQRIDLGVAYWHKHAEALLYAEKEFGVPANIIVAIVGIETLYGLYHFKYPVFNALTTLSFYYPPQTAFFQNELAHYLLLTRELNISPKAVYGSCAGTIGLPQFLPSSYRYFAIPYKRSEKKQIGDLINDSDDVVVSIANYLNYFGWRRNEQVAVPAKVKGNEYRKVLPVRIGEKPTYSIDKFISIAELKKYGVTPVHKLPPRTKAALVQLQNENGYEYWLGLNNFYALAQYNGNKQYIMAVYQLAEVIKRNYQLKDENAYSDTTNQ